MNCITEPVFECTEDSKNPGNYIVKLSFKTDYDMEQIDIISDGKAVCSITDIPKDFTFEKSLPGKGYFRVRGWAKPVDRKYSQGQYPPQFLLNPIFI